MNLIIKQLQGAEVHLQAQPTTTISELKEQIATILKIPVTEQKLLLMGRTLTDSQTISTYPGMKHNAKINLIVKKPEGLLEISTKYFKKQGMSDTEAKNAASRLLTVVEEKVNKLSWDDIEKLSLNIFLEEYGYPSPVAEQEQENECDDVVFGL